MLGDFQIVELTSTAVDREKVEPIRLTPSDDNQTELDWKNPGRLLERHRQYLLIIANDVIGPLLQAKVGASDLVQDTFLQAQRHLDAFRGRTGAELRAWLRTILERRLANIERSYLTAEKRAGTREVPIDMFRAESGEHRGELAGRSPSPSDHAVRSELAAALRQAVGRLPGHYRQAFAWRHHEQLSWEEIGRRMGCSADAARKVWSRAIHQLRTELGDYGPPQ
jgi:RNA polymerase sigma-70 factor (ECF subfamily)